MLDFLGIGAQKAGTTWLFKRLTMHPNIYFPRGKEVHFWDRYDPNQPSSLRHYSSVFRSDHFYLQNQFKIGEITPEYATLTDERLAAVQSFAPNVKIFYALRDPADRMWSALKMHLLLQQKDIKKAELDLLLEMAQRDHFFRQTDYATNISNWLRYFPREQLCVVLFENFNDAPYNVLTRLSRHIGIDPGFYRLLPPAVLGGVVFGGYEAKMTRETRATFVKMFEPTISGVEDFLQRKIPRWRAIDGPHS